MSLLRESKANLIFCLGCVMLLTATTIHAHNYDFIGLDPQQPTVWTIDANWRCSDPGGIPGCSYPGADDTATIRSGFTVRATATQSVKNLTMVNGSTLMFTNFTVGNTFNFSDLPGSTATITSIASPGTFNNNGTM